MLATSLVSRTDGAFQGVLLTYGLASCFITRALLRVLLRDLSPRCVHMYTRFLL